jgi:hypothetical protein
MERHIARLNYYFGGNRIMVEKIGKIVGIGTTDGLRKDGVTPWERWAIEINDTTGATRKYATFEKNMADKFQLGGTYRFSFYEEPGEYQGKAVTYRTLDGWLGEASGDEIPLNNPTTPSNGKDNQPSTPAKEQTLMADHPSKRTSIERQHALTQSIQYHTAKASLETIFDTAQRMYQWTAQLEDPSGDTEKPIKTPDVVDESDGADNNIGDPIFDEDDEE